jgi:tetratricopeptide (TPR) repeat protein
LFGKKSCFVCNKKLGWTNWIMIKGLKEEELPKYYSQDDKICFDCKDKLPKKIQENKKLKNTSEKSEFDKPPISKHLEKSITSHLETDNWIRVIQDGLEVISEFPNHSYGYSIMGDAHLILENYTDATRCFDKALSLNSNSYLNWFQLALALEQSKEFQKAINAYRKALELDSDNKYGKRNFLLDGIELCQKNIDSEKNTESISDFDTIVEDNQENNPNVGLDEDPLKILKIRLAKGEITTEEYEELKSVLE